MYDHRLWSFGEPAAAGQNRGRAGVRSADRPLAVVACWWEPRCALDAGAPNTERTRVQRAGSRFTPRASPSDVTFARSMVDEPGATVPAMARNWPPYPMSHQVVFPVDRPVLVDMNRAFPGLGSTIRRQDELPL